MIRKLALVALTTLSLLVLASSSDLSPWRGLSPTEEAFAIASAHVLDVDPALTDHTAAVAGGRNACWLINQLGLDPATLDGWEQHWHQPWEREWLAAAVTFLCPA